jgi:hypothetical protein
MLFATGINTAFVRSADLVESFAKFGYPPNTIVPIGLSALLASVLYMIPRTAVLGAILLTGYLGGAVATHARINDPMLVAPIIVGILVWLGLYLRDERLRTLVPLRRP